MFGSEIQFPLYLQPRKGNLTLRVNLYRCDNGSVVQLVRIHACHAWGRGFESRPDRKVKQMVISNYGHFAFIYVFSRIIFLIIQ